MMIRCQEKTAFQRRVRLEVVGLALALAADQLLVGSNIIMQLMLNLPFLMMTKRQEKTAFRRRVRLEVVGLALAQALAADQILDASNIIMQSMLNLAFLTTIKRQEKTAFQRRVRLEEEVEGLALALAQAADQLSTCHSAAVALRPSPSAHLTRRECTSHTSPKCTIPKASSSQLKSP